MKLSLEEKLRTSLLRKLNEILEDNEFEMKTKNQKEQIENA
jgi:hypothetical protein